MAENGDEDGVSRQQFSVAYDGTSRRDNHTIEVQTLAPALLAVGKLIREANAQINQKSASAKILVVSDFEHKCFNINFEVVVTFIQQIKSFLGSDDVQTAKTILEWLGLLGFTGYSGKVTYLKYLEWKRGRAVVETRDIVDKDGKGVVQVRIEGEHNSVQVDNYVYHFSENPKALRATRDAFLPLGQDGFDRMRITGYDGTFLAELNSDEVEHIVASCNVGIEQAKETTPELDVTTAWLSVYSPVFDPRADKWRFRLGTNVVYVDISETSIATDAMERGGAFTDDAYQVRLEITTPFDAQGRAKEPSYRILEVIKFVQAEPPMRQDDFLEPPDP